MARKRRQWFPGATYHVMSRGNRKQDIFSDDEDYECFQKILRMAQYNHNFKVHAYCLMTNHYHILLETMESEIWFIMKEINESYARYYNKKYHFTGHLFQGRYTSVLIKNSIQFLSTSQYIHSNPVKAKIVNKPEEYSWSSYKCLIGDGQDPYVTTEDTWEHFMGPGPLLYREFVEDYLEENGMGSGALGETNPS